MKIVYSMCGYGDYSVFRYVLCENNDNRVYGLHFPWLLPSCTHSIAAKSSIYCAPQWNAWILCTNFVLCNSTLANFHFRVVPVIVIDEFEGSHWPRLYAITLKQMKFASSLERLRQYTVLAKFSHQSTRPFTRMACSKMTENPNPNSWVVQAKRKRSIYAFSKR